MNTAILNTVEFPKLGLEFEFDPIAFSIGNIHIAWYGILIAAGILLAMAFGISQCKRFGIIADKLMNAALGGVIGGIVGARLYYVIFSWDNYKDDLMSIFHTWEGGMAIYGGLIGGLGVGLLVAKLCKIRIRPVLDVASMGFLIGQCIGRWGNFINVEAFGGNTDLPWGMTSPTIAAYLREHMSELGELGMNIDPSAPVHPCFLYESLWCALGFLLLFLYRKHRKFDGEIFLMYSVWYGAGRFVIEGLRTDSLLIGTIRVSQLLAGLVVVAGVILWIVIRSRIRTRHDPEYLKLYVNTEAYQQELADYEAKLRKSKDKSGKKKKSGKGSEDNGVEVVDLGSFSGEETVSEPVDDGTRVAGEEPPAENTAEESKADGQESEGTE